MKKKTVAVKKTVAKKVIKKVVAKVSKPRAPKKENALVVIQSPVSGNSSITIASELADDAMIEAEIMGEVAQHYIYEFPQDGGTVRGLSTKGVNEVVRRLSRDAKSGSKIRVSPDHLIKEEVVRDGEKGIEVSVFAEDLVTGNSAWGIKFEPWNKQKRDGGTYKNTHAVEKALTKAERNAKRKLIPEMLCVKMMEKIIKENPAGVKKLEPVRTLALPVRPVAPVSSTPEQIIALTIKAIGQAKTVEAVFAIVDKAKTSRKLSQDDLDQIDGYASARVDVLQ